MKALIIASAMAFLALTGASQAQAVRIATEGAYAPYNFLDDNGKPAGYEIDLGTELCKRAALECTFMTNEWDSIIPNLVAGNYDAIMAGMSITDERKQTIDFSDAYYPPDPSKYAGAAGKTFDFDNLKGLKIGAQSGTIQAAYIDEHFKDGNTIQTYDTADQAMADLLGGNLDLMLGDGGYIDPAVAGNPAIAVAGPDVLIGDGIGIGLRKGDTDLAGKLNTALAAAKKDGTVDKLIAQWFEGRGPFYAE